MPAAVGLREVGRQPVGPAVGVLELVDRRQYIVRLGAPGPIAAPFVAGLLIGVLGSEITRAEAAHAGGAEQQGIFDPRAEAPQTLRPEALVKALLLLAW